MTRITHRLIFGLIIQVLFLNLIAGSLSSPSHTAADLGHASSQLGSLDTADHGHDHDDDAEHQHDHCPACPTTDHSSGDHSHSSCEHHSSLYFGAASLRVAYHPYIHLHPLRDPLSLFPEVYLDRFIPPEVSSGAA